MTTALSGYHLEVSGELCEMALIRLPLTAGSGEPSSHGGALTASSVRARLSELWAPLFDSITEGGRLAVSYRPQDLSVQAGFHHDIARDIRAAGFTPRTEVIWRVRAPHGQPKESLRELQALGHDPRSSAGQIQVYNRGTWRLAGDRSVPRIGAKDFLRWSDGFWSLQPRHPPGDVDGAIPDEVVRRTALFYTYRGNHLLLSSEFGERIRTLLTKAGRRVSTLSLSSSKILKVRPGFAPQREGGPTRDLVRASLELPEPTQTH